MKVTNIPEHLGDSYDGALYKLTYLYLYLTVCDINMDLLNQCAELCENRKFSVTVLSDISPQF